MILFVFLVPYRGRTASWAQLRLLIRAPMYGLFRVAVSKLSDFTWEFRALRECVPRDPNRSCKTS